MFKKSIFFVSFVLLLAMSLGAQVPQLINYQGVLTDASDKPLNGSYSIKFSIYSGATIGSILWSETLPVTVADGLFNVMLGSATPIPYTVFDGKDKFLGIKVGSDPEMTPRKQLVSVGYSFRAYDADKVDGKDATEFLQAGQANSISNGMIQANAVTVDKISPNIVSRVDGVTNDGGNIDLVAGSNITITPDDANNRITIAASGGTTGDNLGNHTASANIKLNGHWLSNDGDNEGIFIATNGNIGIASSNPTERLYVTGTIRGNTILAETTAQIRTGSPTSSYNNGDITSTANLLADDNISAKDGYIRTGSPSRSYSAGDIASTNNIIADNNIEALNVSASNFIFTTSNSGMIHTGTPSGGSYGDIASTRNLWADEDLIVNDHACINRSSVDAAYQLYVSGSAFATGVWNSSDIMFKQNINEIETPLDKVKRLRGVTYEWKKDAYPEKEFPAGNQLGLIAQEVEKIFPEIVKEDDNGEKAIAYFQLIPVLIEAIKQQQKMIEDLQAKLNR